MKEIKKVLFDCGELKDNCIERFNGMIQKNRRLGELSKDFKQDWDKSDKYCI